MENGAKSAVINRAPLMAIQPAIALQVC
jgi:hypothetical protein